jgi:hypothetical protein
MRKKKTRLKTKNKNMTNKNIVISFFDLSGVLVKPWADAGYECHIIDMQHPPGETIEGSLTKWGMDVFEWERVFFEKYPEKIDEVAFASFFPPCTDLAVSGARWFAQKEIERPGGPENGLWSWFFGQTEWARSYNVLIL